MRKKKQAELVQSILSGTENLPQPKPGDSIDKLMNSISNLESYTDLLFQEIEKMKGNTKGLKNA